MYANRVGLSIFAILAVAGTTPAMAWTQDEIDAAVRSVDMSVMRDCAKGVGKVLEQRVETRDLNGDGIDEIILSTQAPGASGCFGWPGNQMDLLISDGRGGWQQHLGYPAATFEYHRRADSAWPDIEITGPGFCFPIWRHHQGTYGIWKTCEDGKLVFAEGLRDGAVPSGVVKAATGGGIGTQKPVDIVDITTLDGIPYDHNGSIVIVNPDKGIIAYSVPKKSIAGTVRPGTVLFRGKPWDHNDPDATLMEGVAYTFKEGCDAAVYDVRGRYHLTYRGQQFTLEGAAPVRARKSCKITGHDMTSANAKLVFNIAWD